MTEMCPTFLGPGGTEPNHCGCLESDGWKEKQEVGVLVLTERCPQLPLMGGDANPLSPSRLAPPTNPNRNIFLPAPSASVLPQWDLRSCQKNT